MSVRNNRNTCRVTPVPRCFSALHVMKKMEELESMPLLAMLSTPRCECLPTKFSSSKYRLPSAEWPPRPSPSSLKSPALIMKPFCTTLKLVPLYPTPASLLPAHSCGRWVGPSQTHRQFFARAARQAQPLQQPCFGAALRLTLVKFSTVLGTMSSWQSKRHRKQRQWVRARPRPATIWQEAQLLWPMQCNTRTASSSSNL